MQNTLKFLYLLWFESNAESKLSATNIWLVEDKRIEVSSLVYPYQFCGNEKTALELKLERSSTLRWWDIQFSLNRYFNKCCLPKLYLTEWPISVGLLPFVNLAQMSLVGRYRPTNMALIHNFQ